MKSSFKRPAPGKKPGAPTAAPSPGPKKVVAPPGKVGPGKKPVAPAARTALPVKGPTPRPAPKKEKVVEAELELVDTPSTEEATEAEQQEADEPTGREVVVRESEVNMFSAPVGQPVGDFDASDYEMPQLKVAQGSDSPLINDLGFADGDLVLNNESILWQDGCEPVELTVLRFQKQFMQQLDYGADEMPKIYNTAAEAIADGLVPFGGHEVGFVSFANAIVLIKRGDGIECSIFDKEHEDQVYGVALWRITGTAYKGAARRIMSHMRTRLKAGSHTGSFLLELSKERGKRGPYWSPRLKEGVMHDEAFIEFAKTVAEEG